MFKKLVSVLLSIMLLFNGGAEVAKAETNKPDIYDYVGAMPYSSEYVSAISKYIDIASDGTMICEVQVIGYSGVTTEITITITLQKKTLFWWSDVKTWSYTFENYKGTYTVEKKVDKSGTYRAKIDIVVSGANSSEEMTYYTDEVEY